MQAEETQPTLASLGHPRAFVPCAVHLPAAAPTSQGECGKYRGVVVAWI